MTSPVLHQWPSSSSQHRHSEVSAVVGTGVSVWERATFAVLRWRVKTSNGSSVDSTEPAAPGQRLTVTAKLFGMTVHEPVEVVAVAEDPGRVGFSYKTLPDPTHTKQSESEADATPGAHSETEIVEAATASLGKHTTTADELYFLLLGRVWLHDARARVDVRNRSYFLYTGRVSENGA
ncbi:DUF1990 family protein [Arthrobacter sp. TMN-49]